MNKGTIVGWQCRECKACFQFLVKDYTPEYCPTCGIKHNRNDIKLQFQKVLSRGKQ